MDPEVAFDVVDERDVASQSGPALVEMLLEPVLRFGFGLEELGSRPLSAIPAALAPAGLPAILPLARPAALPSGHSGPFRPWAAARAGLDALPGIDSGTSARLGIC